MIRFLSIIFTVVILHSCSTKENKEGPATYDNLITAGGTISEIIYELGYGNRIIATDITSTFPASLQQLPSIGYRNQIKAEGIFALGPDAVLMEEGYLSAEVLSQLQASGLPVYVFKKPVTVQESKDLIMDLGKLFQEEEKAAGLISQMEGDLAKLKANATTTKNTAVFIMARGPETVFLAGEETFASALFEVAGLEPAARGFKDFIPLTPEALIQYDPDHIILFESGLQSLGGKGGLSKINGIQQTKAYINNNIHAFDGHYLSGFGPRVGKAALDLQALKH
ncbi:heme/hemin ABC transporter substrate-binding protein [Anditalea andensis]|uniref:ABC transporter substrate-binding protein n=1 Tax=Anditalea andensis TaxID=1048983 RepID=A0A074LEF4_9BACT|nr:ABC transporter substrate-binding protein [Anditalea andensis]KEO72147.1 ABC transporter substrate-binding protein [Anditalea andensis]